MVSQVWPFGRSMWILASILVVGSFHPLSGMASDTNWSVREGPDPVSGGQRCLLESAEKTVDDGQTTTSMRVVFTGDAFVVITDSKVDLSYPDVGIRVDSQDAVPVDRMLGETSVVFDSDVDGLVERFARGTELRVALGFWPTTQGNHPE